MKKSLIIILLGILFFASCSKEDNPVNQGDGYDRTALLTSWADNIILPRMNHYQSKIVALVAQTTAFTTSPNTTELANLRNAWLEAYKAYQYVGAFNIGKAEEINLNATANTYPTDASGIQTNIINGGYNFDLLSQYSKQGFPAIDYMIYGLDTDDSVLLGFYTTHVDATKYKLYLNDLSSKLKSNIDAVLADWNAAYRSAYINSNGNTISSSVNKTVNEFVKYFEKDIRAGKVGIPAGVYSSGTLFPEKTEAYYKNDVSKLLLEEALKGAKDFFNGVHFSTNVEGLGLKSYLNYLNAIRDGQSLSTVINNQFVTIQTTNQQLESSFTQTVNTNNAKMLSSFDELQKQVVYLKLDMMQALNITVDYVDADGD